MEKCLIARMFIEEEDDVVSVDVGADIDENRHEIDETRGF